jgi:hypothetical protein
MLQILFASAIGCIIGTFIGRFLVDYLVEKGYWYEGENKRNEQKGIK